MVLAGLSQHARGTPAEVHTAEGATQYWLAHPLETPTSPSPPPATSYLPSAGRLHNTRPASPPPVSARPSPPQHYLHLAHHLVRSYECAHYHCVMMSLSNVGQSINEFVSKVIVCHESLGRPVSPRRPVLVSCHLCCSVKKSLGLFFPSVRCLPSFTSVQGKGRAGRIPRGCHPRVQASSRRPPDIQ